MGKTDEFDRHRAAAYAWRFVAPGETIPDDEREQPDADPPQVQPEAKKLSEEEVEQAREAAYQACAALAAGVDRAWALAEPQQAPAVEQLVLRAGQLGLDVVAMLHFPQQSVRLVRLAIRCRDRLSEQAMEAAEDCVAWLDYTHPEVIDLLVEVAVAGESMLGAGIQMALHGENAKVVARSPGASARFARLLEEGPSVTARRFALQWLDIAGVHDAVPALRRMLRGRHFSLRFRALELLERRAPRAVEADDIASLVLDLEAHPAPERHNSEENHEAHTFFPELIMGALVRLRPVAAAGALARIADSERDGIFSGLGGFNATWALCALAAAFPEQAVMRIDRLLRRVEWDRRMRAAEASGRLPDELAWPRLLEAAADPVPEVAERAQDIWLKRRGSLCPVGELAGIETALLDSPPSERMLSRLGVLRRAPLEARAAMMEVLFGEAPDPEALVLLLFAANDSRLWVRTTRPGLPKNRAAFCHAIIAGFDARGVQGLCAVAARYPDGRWGWLNALADEVQEGTVPEAALPRLRAVAVKPIAEMPGRVQDEMQAMQQARDALRILGKVGAPLELAPRLWSLAWGRCEQHYLLRETFRDAVAGALATLPEGDARRDGVVEKMERALASRDLPAFADAAWFGLRLGLAEAITLSERVLAEHIDGVPSDPAVTDALELCVKELDRLGRIDERLSATVARPGTVAFCLAARRPGQNATPQELDAFRAALASDEPSTAAEAATALLRADAIDAQSEQLIAIAARAPLRVRSELVWNLVFEKAAARSLWPLLAEILVSTDPEVADRFDCLVHRLAQSDVQQDLFALAPSVASPYLAARIDECLPAQEQEAYWEDDEEDDDDTDPDAGSEQEQGE